jgi:hypothetical protein
VHRITSIGVVPSTQEYWSLQGGSMHTPRSECNLAILTLAVKSAEARLRTRLFTSSENHHLPLGLLSGWNYQLPETRRSCTSEGIMTSPRVQESDRSTSMDLGSGGDPTES